MSKQIQESTNQNNQTAVIVSVNNPISPLDSGLLQNKKFTDPSSAIPNGACYPVPNSFEYRVRPKHIESI